jgi:hypothetical protein
MPDAADGKKLYPLTVAPAGVLLWQNQSIPDVFGGKPQEPSGHEKTPVFLAKYWGF